jgi:hypothetical protein
MANRVFSSCFMKSMFKAGKQGNVRYAVETKSWIRQGLSTDTQEKFVEALAKADIPARATTAIMT